MATEAVTAAVRAAVVEEAARVVVAMAAVMAAVGLIRSDWRRKCWRCVLRVQLDVSIVLELRDRSRPFAKEVGGRVRRRRRVAHTVGAIGLLVAIPRDVLNAIVGLIDKPSRSPASTMLTRIELSWLR